MGRVGVGEASGAAAPGGEGDNRRRRREPNAGSFGLNRANLDAGAGTRFERKHALPSVGDRFGELTVIGFNHGPAGGILTIQVQCSCGAAPHRVFDYNLRNGKSTRCRLCASKQAGFWRKRFHGYADIVPDEAHRVRLLNRISACFNRCTNPNDAGFHSYGARGIGICAAWVADRKEFLRYLVSLDGWDRPKLELDRIDVDRGYEPGNLRFVSKRVNQGNRRKVRVMQARIDELERENADLRSRLQRAEESLYGAVRPRAADRP